MGSESSKKAKLLRNSLKIIQTKGKMERIWNGLKYFCYNLLNSDSIKFLSKLSNRRIRMKYVTSRNVSCPKMYNITTFYSTITSRFFCFHWLSTFTIRCCMSCWSKRTSQMIGKMSSNWNFGMTKNTKSRKMNHWVNFILPFVVETISSAAVATGSWARSIFLFSWWLDHKSVPLHFLVIHFFDSSVGIVIVLEFLN